MKKNKSTIILILVFFVGLSVMLYPTISDYVNQLHQTRAVANYAADVDKLSDADYTAYFEAADAFNAQIAADPDALYFPDRFPSYESTLDVTGTGIMGYITIEKIGVELPIYHGTSDAVLQVAAGHLEGTRAVPAPTRSFRPTGACPVPSCSPIWISWRWATPSPSRCWTGLSPTRWTTFPSSCPPRPTA